MVFAPKARVRAANAARTHRGAAAHNPRTRPRPPPTTQTFLLVLDSRAHLVLNGGHPKAELARGDLCLLLDLDFAGAPTLEMGPCLLVICSL